MTDADNARTADLPDRERRIRVDQARAALKDLLQERDTLASAMSELGDPLDLQAVEDAFASRSSDSRVRVQLAALSWAATTCCNQINVLVQSGVVLAGLREPEAPGEPRPSVTSDYALLEESGVIRPDQRRLLSELNQARIALTHRYGQSSSPGDLHRAASLASKVLDTFGPDYGPWLQSLGILPGGSVET